MNDRSARRCLVLCEPQLGSLYRTHFGGLVERTGIQLAFVEHPEEFTRECLGESPLVGLADMGSIIRGDTDKMNRLFDYRVRWPVVRCQLGSDGRGQLMRMRPPLKGASLESLEQISQGGSAWELSHETRHHLRARVRCRGRIGLAGAEAARPVNIQTLSQAGCLILCDAPPEPGTQLSLEIQDLPAGSVRLEAEVAWRWTWDVGRFR